MAPALLFVGPTLWDSRLDVPPHVERRPPARCGDLLRAARDRPAAIGLIDGLFEAGPCVWHKEILAVIAAGIPVIGAASLGALRAAELDRLGMIGVGAVYESYRDGRETRDDAVMVSHAPAALDYRPLTVALVDVADAAEVLPQPMRAPLLRVAERINFRDRTWRALRLAFARATGEALPRLDRHAGVKCRDAEALVALLAEGGLTAPSIDPPPPTIFLERLRAISA